MITKSDTTFIVGLGNGEVGDPEGPAMALEVLSGEKEAELDLRAVRGLDKGVLLASFD